MSETPAATVPVRKSPAPDKSVNTSSGCEDASPRWQREATLRDAMALGYPPNEAIAWVCGYNVARAEMQEADGQELTDRAALRLTVDDRQGQRVTAYCEVVGIKRLNDGTFEVTVVRPGGGDNCPQVAVHIDGKGAVRPQRGGVFNVW